MTKHLGYEWGSKLSSQKFRVILIITILSGCFLWSLCHQLGLGYRNGNIQKQNRFQWLCCDPATGFCCVDRVTEEEGLAAETPMLTCTHKKVEQCHYTYVTQFSPVQEKVCKENFKKQCSITFRQQAYNETV